MFETRTSKGLSSCPEISLIIKPINKLHFIGSQLLHCIFCEIDCHEGFSSDMHGFHILFISRSSTPFILLMVYSMNSLVAHEMLLLSTLFSNFNVIFWITCLSII